MAFGSNAGHSDYTVIALNEFHDILLAADRNSFEAADRWLTGETSLQDRLQHKEEEVVSREHCRGSQ